MAKTKLKKAALKKVSSPGKKPPKKTAQKKTSLKKKPLAKALPKKAGLVNKIKKTLKKALHKSGAPAKIVESKKELKNKSSSKASGAKALAKAPAKAVKAELASKASPPQKRVPLGPIEPGRLGQKRHCLECGTKFYDFERLPITCPKCFSEFDPEDFEPKISLKSDSKKSRPVEKEEEPETEIVASESGEDFESLEDLSDDDSAVVGIETGKDSDESFD